MPVEWIPWCQDNKTNKPNNTKTSNPCSYATNLEETSSTATTSATSNTTSTNTSGSPSTSTRKSSSSSFWKHAYWKRPATVFEDLLTMGSCWSRGVLGGAMLIEEADGDEQDYHNRFIEDRVLGEGEFGVVTLVHDMQAASNPDENTMACKALRKGVVFKDNTLYAPIKTEILQSEVQILRTLNGEHFCMAMKGVYETPRIIYMVTEYCAGGEMMEYVSKQEEDLRTDDVSRVAFQLLDSVNHCAQHKIIHRDIKPENIMFQHPTPGSDLRLIDFGSGTRRVVEGHHTTFAGSAFYISPEMFQRTYTQKTDVWSVGVTLYVLVAGYPADVLQRAFNMLHKTTRNLRKLPNFPDNMPDSFYDMLEGILVYRHKKRKSAGELLDHEFVQFHKTAFTVEQIFMEAQQEATDSAGALNSNASGSKRNNTLSKTQSVALRGSVGRHTLFLDYQKYQRSLTTLLATLLDKNELQKLVEALNERLSEKRQEKTNDDSDEQPLLPQPGTRLDVIPIHELKQVLVAQKQEQVLAMIAKLPGSGNYNTFAYEVALLKDFVRDEDRKDGASQSVRSGRKKQRGSGNGSFRGSFRGTSIFGRKLKLEDSSVHSTGSLRGRNNASMPKTMSVHGGSGDSLFREWKSGGMKNPRLKGGEKMTKSQSEAAVQKNLSQ